MGTPSVTVLDLVECLVLVGNKVVNRGDVPSLVHPQPVRSQLQLSLVRVRVLSEAVVVDDERCHPAPLAEAPQSFEMGIDQAFAAS